MKASKQFTEKEQMTHQQDIPIDPFAVDFFGGKNLTLNEADSIIEKAFEVKRRVKTHKKSDWYKGLQRISNPQAEFSFLLQNLSENLTDDFRKIIVESIAHFTFRQTENVKCSLISVSEIDLNEALSKSAESSQIFLTLGCQPDNSPAFITFTTEFARTIIDLILSGQGSDLANPRNLSPIENTIVEFLAVNILGEINEYLGEPLLLLQNVKNEFSAEFIPFERGVEVVFSLELDDFKGFVRLLTPQTFLNGLDKSQNSLLLKKSNRKPLGYFEKLIGKVDLRLQLGATFLDADSLSFLEPDDIVLIEQPQISLGNTHFVENLQIFVGRGRNVCLQGVASSNELSGELNFKIGEILSEEMRRKFTPAKFKMDEIENELPETETATGQADEQFDEGSNEEITDEQISPSLENVQIALRVEIAGNKLSLRELQALRAGQIIGLGCRPTDPVRLVTDNNEDPVATGELVEIEGQLGVRLTKVFI